MTHTGEPAAGVDPAEQPEPTTAAQLGLLSCEACQLLTRPASDTETGYCPRCGEHLEFRHHPTLETSWALLIAAAICLVDWLLLLRKSYYVDSTLFLSVARKLTFQALSFEINCCLCPTCARR